MTKHYKNAAHRFTVLPLCMAAFSLMTSTVVNAQDLTLSETGSTLMYPLFATWVAEYTKSHPGIHITVGETGSEAGIQQVLASKVQIGASDAYMSDAEMRQHPQIINVPLAIAAQTVNYNLPGLNATHLKMAASTGPSILRCVALRPGRL